MPCGIIGMRLVALFESWLERICRVGRQMQLRRRDLVAGTLNNFLTNYFS